MPRFAANLTLLYTDRPFLDRFAAAAADGFEAVECLFPYDHPPEAIANRLRECGLTLALMTLPTVIIAGRAALMAVPPSIREAALGLGASRMQMVGGHVLPLAMPGMLTGAIIGMARALGETAPLLMIGMVAFIVDLPRGPLDSAAVLPVQIYLWADSPERAFVERTSAATIVLLVFLILMNLGAVLLRKRFEKRW